MPNPLSRTPRDHILFGPTRGPAPAGYYLLPQATFTSLAAATATGPVCSATDLFTFLDANPTSNYIYLGPNQVTISNRHVGYVSTRWGRSWNAPIDPRLQPLELLRPRQHAYLHYMRGRVLIYLSA